MGELAKNLTNLLVIPNAVRDPANHPKPSFLGEPGIA